jgi:ABC-type oligopeptide transport system substrate-binding subunit
MDRRQFLAAASGFALATSVPSLAQGQGVTPVTGGTLNIGFISDVRTLNPIQSAQWTERQILFLIFDTLLEIAPDFSLRPALAKSWEFADKAAGGDFFSRRNPVQCPSSEMEPRRTFGPKWEFLAAKAARRDYKGRSDR